MNDMSVEELEKRAAEIDAMNLAEMTDADASTALADERDAIAAELESRKAAAAKAAEIREQVANDQTLVPVKTFETRKEEKEMSIAEIRSSMEYNKAYLNALKGNDAEARALLSGNVSGGQIPVPTMLETEIKNAWENHQVMSLVKKSFYPGNVKIGFELSATGAVIHTEGTAAPEEEVLEIGSVELKAENIKKWITVSDEAIEGTTVDTIGYLYAEIAHKIVEKAEEVMIGKINAAPTASTATAVAVADFTAAVDVDTMVMAVAQLSAQAKNLNVVMNRQTYAAFVSAALKNKYGADVFDGLRDRVVYTDKLPAYSAAGSGDTYAIVGDFGYGAQANFPNGNDITMKLDDLSLAEKDLVKIVGRQYVGMGVVAPNAFVRIKKA